MNILKTIKFIKTVWSAANGKKTIFGAVVSVCGGIFVFFGYEEEAKALIEWGEFFVDSGAYIMTLGIVHKVIKVCLDMLKKWKEYKEDNQ